jgi:uncharacterized protein YdeI (YjbR/CyaY-like superfamily)
VDILFFKSQAELHAWLEINHNRHAELTVGFYNVKSKKESISYKEAVDEALIFGWIDGVRTNIDKDTYKIRFTPRKKSSIWSAVNIKRIEELIAAGIAEPAGISAFTNRDVTKTGKYSHEQEHVTLSEAYETLLKENNTAYTFFHSQAAYYKKAAAWWVMSAQKEETKIRRLHALIEACHKHEKLKQLTYAAQTTPKR